MARNMSFALTTEQFKNKTKTVTRRIGWKFLKPGEIVCGVEKAMGFKKGEKIKRLGYIRILSVTREYLGMITPSDVSLEGFPRWTKRRFISFLISKSPKGTNEGTIVTRIEFEYVDGPDG